MLSLGELSTPLRTSCHSLYILKAQKQILTIGSYSHARGIPYYSGASKLNHHTIPQLGHILSQLNPIHICNNFSNIHLNTVPPRMSTNRSADMTTKTLNKLINKQALRLLTCIRKVPGSNKGRRKDYQEIFRASSRPLQVNAWEVAHYYSTTLPSTLFPIN
jgi:hypothetical protein